MTSTSSTGTDWSNSKGSKQPVSGNRGKVTAVGPKRRLDIIVRQDPRLEIHVVHRRLS